MLPRTMGSGSKDIGRTGIMVPSKYLGGGVYEIRAVDAGRAQCRPEHEANLEVAPKTSSAFDSMRLLRSDYDAAASNIRRQSLSAAESTCRIAVAESKIYRSQSQKHKEEAVSARRVSSQNTRASLRTRQHARHGMRVESLAA